MLKGMDFYNLLELYLINMEIMYWILLQKQQ